MFSLCVVCCFVFVGFGGPGGSFGAHGGCFFCLSSSSGLPLLLISLKPHPGLQKPVPGPPGPPLYLLIAPIVFLAVI